ncbi:PTS system ascorbate-specific enzyme IIC/IIB [Spiroplasma clarkii]|uniref:Ascorbate-specific PTS system EIIC component n=1 Tax=Spiroplasma clarkii TaxID=2139 RepID=A0A1Y0L248_9MOLU|nr:PTS ascorbate transporter subunit IIC [Spiroplasma clarkii]ARU91850.1 PTS system ascorbate-specific enzyme IIC/IIB [Spiroplasma clarkii]ATX71203.1 PTS system, ascorbate-specific IIC component [Spiroplasma clarkii]
MNVFLDILSWISNNIFGQAVFLIAIIVLLGHLVQRSSFSKTFTGIIKSTMGFLIISAGAGLISSASAMFGDMYTIIFGMTPDSVQAVYGAAYSSPIGAILAAADALIDVWGKWVPVIMTCGFLINLTIAGTTRIKYIYLTGHLMYWTSFVTLGVALTAFPQVEAWMIVVIISVAMGLYWTLQPAIMGKMTKDVMGVDNLGFGHTSSSGGFLGYWFGAMLTKTSKGKTFKDAEQINLPKSLSWLRDNTAVTAIVMIFLMLLGSIIIAIMALVNKTGDASILVQNAFEGMYGFENVNIIVASLIVAIQFTAGIAIVLYGVKLFIGEIIPAFKGISTKVVPNAKAALDCPIIFTKAPNAVILGFLGGFVTAMLWMVVLGFGIGYVFLPSMIVIFFNCGAAGVFGNKSGGWVGALVAGAITSTIVALGQWVMFASGWGLGTINESMKWAADNDMFVIMLPIYFIFMLFKLAIGGNIMAAIGLGVIGAIGLLFMISLYLSTYSNKFNKIFKISQPIKVERVKKIKVKQTLGANQGEKVKIDNQITTESENKQE